MTFRSSYVLHARNRTTGLAVVVRREAPIWKLHVSKTRTRDSKCKNSHSVLDHNIRQLILALRHLNDLLNQPSTNLLLQVSYPVQHVSQKPSNVIHSNGTHCSLVKSGSGSSFGSSARAALPAR